MTQEKARLSSPVSTEQAQSLSINPPNSHCVLMVPQTPCHSVGKTSFAPSALFSDDMSMGNNLHLSLSTFSPQRAAVIMFFHVNLRIDELN